MKLRKKRTLWKQITAKAVICFVLLCPLTVQAGDINGAEQSIIDYYNRTFYYDGKYYVATEEAKAAVYQEMIAEGVDLTEEQSESAIRQASKNIASGIAQGYLVEVPSEDSGAGEGDENGSQPGAGESDENGSQPGTGEGDENESQPGAGEGNENGNQPGTGEGNENENQPGAGEGDENGSQLGAGESNENGSQPGAGKNDETAQKPVKVPSKLEISNTEIYVQTPGRMNENSNSVQEILQKLPENESVITQNFVEAEVEARVGDKIILENTLPVKNTGYDTIKLRYLLSGMAVVLSMVMAAALYQIYFAYKHDRKE